MAFVKIYGGGVTIHKRHPHMVNRHQYQLHTSGSIQTDFEIQQYLLFVKLSPILFVFCVMYMGTVLLLKKQPTLTKGLFSLTIGSGCPSSVKKRTKELRNPCALSKSINPQSYIYRLVLYLTQPKFWPEY